MTQSFQPHLPITIDGTCSGYDLVVEVSEVAGITRDALQAYKGLLADASGDSAVNCGLMASLPDLDYSKEA